MKPKHILFGLLALIAASCTNDDLNEVAEMKQNGIQVTAGLTANTRVSFEQDGDVTHAFWEEGDQITLYAPSQGYFTYQVSILSEDATSATFTSVYGALQNTDETIYAAYTPDMAPDIVDGTAVLPYTDLLTGEHPLPFAYAISKVADGKLNLSFEHIFAYLKLTLDAETVAGSDVKEITDVYLTNPSGTPISIAAGRFDFSTQSIIEDKGVNYINYSLPESFSATGRAAKSIYIPILPQAAGEKIKLSVLHVTSSGCDTLFTETKEVPSTGFVAGRAYTYSPKSSITRVGNTVTLTEAGTLSQAISAAEKDTITSLKIIGPLNGDDIRFIREMAGRDVEGNETIGKLTYLDISEASIVAGGGYYFATEYESYYTENDEIGWGMFEKTIIENIQLPQNATLIGPSAFAYSSLKRITIPNGVTSIGGNAFVGSASLVNVTIPEGVTEIPASAFSSCTSLTSISIPSSVTEIAFRAFNGCSSLSSVIIGNGVTSIGDNAFEDCSYLASINLPDALTSIGSAAFHNCSSLASIYIPDAVATIGNGAFYGCTILKSVEFSSESSLTLIDELTFRECSSLISISIPDAVTEIASSAFYECSSLVSAIVGSGVTSIGDNAFYHCTSLESLNLPDAVTSIGESAFSGCSALTSINIPNGVTSINKNTFYNCTSLTSVTIGNGVTSIGETAFFKCSSLTSINLPDALISIGSNAFTASSKLKSITIPSGVTSLADAAFYYCSSLSEVTCEATNPPTLGLECFTGIASPSTLIVPAGCISTYSASDWAQYFTTIDDGEEHGSYENGIATVVTAGTLSTLIPEDEKYTITTLKVVGPLNGDDIRFIREMADAEGNLKHLDLDEATIVEGGGAYHSANYYTDLYTSNDVIGNNMFENLNLENVILPNSVISIGDYAFYECSSLVSVTIPDGVTSIGKHAFHSCSSLISVKIPNGVTIINRDTFNGCESLENIIIPDGVTSIGIQAFSGCSSLTSLIIPNGMIDRNAFYECSSLSSVTIGNGVTIIGENAFYGCESLSGAYISDLSSWCKIYFESVSSNPLYYAKKLYLDNEEVTQLVVPVGIDIINSSAFYNCSSLVSVTIPNSVVSIGDDAFNACSSLTSVTIGDGVTSIGDGAFYGCSSLASINIPETIDLIGDGTFRRCTSLINIDIPNGMIDDRAFEDCSSLVLVTIGDGVTSIGNNAFANCLTLSELRITNSSMLTSIGENAFKGCNSLINFNIPNEVMSIGYSAFSGCSSLVSVKIGGGLTSVQNYAFKDCSSLTSVYISDLSAWCRIKFGGGGNQNVSNGDESLKANPLYYAKKLYLDNEEVTQLVVPEGIDVINSLAFYNCSSLVSVTIPNSVTSIGGSAFYNCSSLNGVTCKATTPPTLGTSAFDGISSPSTLIVPSGCTTAYGASDWAQFFSTIKGENDTDGSDGNVDNLPAEEW